MCAFVGGISPTVSSICIYTNGASYLKGTERKILKKGMTNSCRLVIANMDIYLGFSEQTGNNDMRPNIYFNR